jgi:hypothetical protein
VFKQTPDEPYPFFLLLYLKEGKILFSFLPLLQHSSETDSFTLKTEAICSSETL